MNNEVASPDAEAIELWNAAYGDDVLAGDANLWGDPPVPYALTAADLFRTNSARVVLDLPCGDGRNLPQLAQGCSILLGGDTSQNAMAIAERVVAKAGVRDQTVFVRTDCFDTGLLTDSVDGIFCWDLLGHLTDPGRALVELLRILRPGGRLVANMWTMNDCQTSDPLIKEIEPKIYIDHFNFYCQFYDQQDLEALLESVGLQAESIEVRGWREPPHATYRDYWHDHESLVFVVHKPAA
jgi:SAM-dependent methyltransferase